MNGSKLALAVSLVLFVLAAFGVHGGGFGELDIVAFGGAFLALAGLVA